MAYAEENSARFRRQRTEQAISLAVQSRWAEAMEANQSILAVFKEDVDAYNRLGKAFTELGQYEEARNAYGKALKLEPSNTIARKNLSRLSGLKAAPRTAASVHPRVDPRLFIEEAGKTAVLAVLTQGTKDVLGKITAGEQLQIKAFGKQLNLLTLSSEYVGQLEPRTATRLQTLIDGGNRYEAAVTSVAEGQVKVILREVYQSAKMAGRVSFPARANTNVRPYIKNGILRTGMEDEGEYLLEDDEDTGDWEEESNEEGGIVTVPLPADQNDDDDDTDEDN